MSALAKLIDFTTGLEKNKIYYRLEKSDNAIVVAIAIPGERWDARFLLDGSIELEKFLSDGEVADVTDELEKLLERAIREIDTARDRSWQEAPDA
ncbi:MAG: hypothetical protein LBQ16_01700 [Gracilibacteraceae bacterium]|jgi:hypothetical protein|nr:hypothetical protein [Gracilibacteraceae bacterium]